ncbi:tyrosine-type recombinase/integrase [Planctomycetota bacterium]
MVANNVLRTFRAACIRAGIKTDKSLTLHCLRKSFAQNLADNGTPISTLKELMGHSDIQTTAEFYLQTTDANEQRACQVLDQIMQSENFESDAKMTPRPILGETKKIEKSINPHPVKTYSNRGDGI